MTEIPTVRRLLPGATDGGTADLSLPEAFAFPADARSPADAQSWVRAVFVASVDGAATVAGRAGGLGNAVDRAVFALNRALADVILVGAGTARTEEYGPAEDDFRWRGLREGRSPTAPIAVVTDSLALDFSSPLFVDAPEWARTIVITSESSPAEARAKAAEVAEVIVAGADTVDLTLALAALRERGFERIVCEGGPSVFAELVRAGCADELCLTRSPEIVGGQGTRIVHGPALDPPVPLHLAEVLATDDGYLYLLYRFERS
ncbi:pyrimidine reductase family protein [Brevibacterium casei]|uniref:pyrimidine reductase family protein n=1 Tax=Brevibacterium casei TaxID=33889 RepID=UPI003EC047B1